jgi:SAM-dependent methyltransferase
VTCVASRAERATSFGAIAEDYDRLRSRPSQEAVDWLLPEGAQVVVDLAAGTGLFTRALAGQVAQVIAVEPDPRMRDVLRARSPGVQVLAGAGEAIPLPDASADGVFVHSAWHWLDTDRAVPEIARVLRDGGRLGVIWSGRDRETGWLRAVDQQLAAAPGPEVADRPAAQDRRPAQRRRREVVLPDTGLFGPAETASFAFTRPMTISDIVDMLATYSGLITASPEDRAAALGRARAVLEGRFPGTDLIDVPMRSWCWRADRAHREDGE